MFSHVVGEENPFVVKPTFGFWAPWIGPENLMWF